MEHDELRAELATLVHGFTEQLRRAADRGLRWVPAGATPRRGLPPAAQLPGEASPPSDDSAALESGAGRPDDPAAAGAVHGAGRTPDPAADLEEVRRELGDCQRCRLASGRRNLVFGVGSPQADLMFIGEAPGFDEDRLGEPFVGKAGQLLTRMIGAMGLSREGVYIANIIKCRPPKNRDPQPDEVATCEPFLRAQIDAIGPRILIAMGNFAVKTLLRTDTGITRMRGTWRSYHGIPLMPTFHPAYLLRNAEKKRPVWNDLQAVMAKMDELGIPRRETPARGRTR